jgi:chromosome segregation ATPase
MSRWSRATAVGRTRVIGSSGWPSRRVWAMTLFAISCTTRSRLGYGSAGRVLARMGSSALGLENVTTQEDISQVAAQLADLTQTVEAMAKDLKAMTERADTQEARADTQEERADTQEERADTQEERADNQEERADTQEARADNWQTIAGGQDVLALKQQERIDLAARELADVSHRLQAAATLLQESGVYSAPISRKRLRVE